MMLRIAILFFVFFLGIEAGRWGYSPTMKPGLVCSTTIPRGSTCSFWMGPTMFAIADGRYTMICDIPLGDGGLP